ncbi:MAG: hypothetical protein ABID54_05650 [Pseudomonadota bacterium]
MEEKKTCPLYKAALLINMSKQIVDREKLKRYTECDKDKCQWWIIDIEEGGEGCTCTFC